MRLISFQVFNFRSITDSGEIKVSRNTAILGRNESGKSNLLLALRSLNPPGGFHELNRVKDFPRHRRLEECHDETPVLTTTWELSPKEQSELVALLPRAKGVTQIQIGRWYGARRWVTFLKLAAQAFNEADIKAKLRKVVPAVMAAASKLEAPARAELEKAAASFEAATELQSDRTVWAANSVKGFAALRTAMAKADKDFTEKQEDVVLELEEIAKALAGDEEAQQKARNWAVKQLPTFIYLDEYPELSGHQNIAQYVGRKAENKLTDADVNFEKMCKVAGLKPSELQDLLSKKEQETRNQLANRASAVVTSEIKRLWKDRPLKVRFNLDAEFLDTFVSDPNATFDVEVNLDERSRGFKWFFSFYITFSADTNGGSASNAILLLDEPGLYLHARSQSDLLVHLKKDFANQILYTTHSPFMVPTNDLDSIRTVSIAESAGTTVTNDPTGDARTLFPLQAALGYDLAQSLFVGPNNLVVEGVTDYWILSSISSYLGDVGRVSLSPELTLTPAGGAQKISYMVALLTSEQLNVLVLFDDEKDARTTKDELVKSKLINENSVVFTTEAFQANAPKEADIEDLLDSKIYEALMHEAYANELKGKALAPNKNIPRIAKRFEAAFAEIGVPFHKTRIARLLLTKMAQDPSKIVTSDVASRFETLFGLINARIKKS